jgi:hypothetical protein
MQVYPLQTMSLEAAMEAQFRLVDTIHRHFSGQEFLTAGDYGLSQGGRPRQTAKVEAVLAQYFGGEDAVLVRGAGTGALRLALAAAVPPGAEILVHAAPIYPTTEATIAMMGLRPRTADYNALDFSGELPDYALIQLSRQAPGDRYDAGQVMAALRARKPGITIISDDNYVVMKLAQIGVGLGADLSTFSCFKLLGPPGVGCVVGKGELVEKIRRLNYSGGAQVQGPEAMEVLRSLVYAPVSLAIQARQGDRIVQLLNRGAVPGVKEACIANAQSRVVLVEFARPVARQVLAAADKYGCATWPVGAESRYEVTAMFYRVSGTFLAEKPELAETMIRINPMRAGADTVVRILRELMASIEEGE